MVYALPRIRPGESDAQSSLVFWHTNRSPNLGQTTRPSDIQQKKGLCRKITKPADDRVKIKESGKRDKYLYLARVLKKL